MKTTLNAIRKHDPCVNGWKQLLQYLGKTEADDEPLLISKILESNGLDDALWCLRAVDGHEKEIRLLAVLYARKVQHLMTDSRSIAALDVAERHAHGKATDDDLAAARAAEAARAVRAAWATEAVGDAARVTGDAARAAWDAAMAAEKESQAIMLLTVCKTIEDTEK
jgi:hypothetical protein